VAHENYIFLKQAYSILKLVFKVVNKKELYEGWKFIQSHLINERIRCYIIQ
jgi:hypothetical protein